MKLHYLFRHPHSVRTRFLFACLAFPAAYGLTGCGAAESIPESRYVESDKYIELVKARVNSASAQYEITDIDHSRLGAMAGSPMPPARVLIFSDPMLESQLIEQNPLVALDLPLRVLAFEQALNSSKIVYNRFDYLVSRYQLAEEANGALGELYDQRLREVTADVPAEAIASFSSDEMDPDGVISIQSPYGFAETVRKVNEAILAQDDTMQFGVVDFQANARALGIEINPSYLVLFGAPGPGGKVMLNAPTLGLDGFCQKFLIWQDDEGQVRLSFNDLLALAGRQNADVALALRVVNFRLNSVFSDALSAN